MIKNNGKRNHYGYVVVLVAAAMQGCSSEATNSESNLALGATDPLPNSTVQSSEEAGSGNLIGNGISGSLLLPLVDGVPTATATPPQVLNSIENSAVPESVAALEAPKPPISIEPPAQATATTPISEIQSSAVVAPAPATQLSTTPTQQTTSLHSPIQELQFFPEPVDQTGFLNDRPSSIQCLEFPDNTIGFNDVDNDDWRSWVAPTKHHYSGATEHLSIVKSSNNKIAMRQQLVPNSKGSQTVSAGAYLSSTDTYRLTQSIYLEPGFDWGGKNEGGKLGFGFGGGTAPTGGKLQTDGFTARFMWRGNKDGTAHITIYSYAADRKQSLPYGDDHPLAGFNVPIGEWFDLAMEVTANSTTSRSDGSLRAWANGVQLLEMDGIQWQASGDKPAVQRLIYTTFYGGNDSSWSPDKTTYIRFTDVCWSPVLQHFEPLNPSLGSARNAAQFEATKDTEGTIFSDFVQNDNANLNYAALAGSPRAVIINGLAEIELLLPIQDYLIDWYIYNALDRLNDSLTESDWRDNYSVKKTSQTIVHLYEAVRDSLAGANVTNAPAFVQSQLMRTSTQLAQAAIDLATFEVNKAQATSLSPNCVDCLTVGLFAQQSQDELTAGQQLVTTAPLGAVEHALQARKAAVAAVNSAGNSAE